jgi:Transglutaminase-like superfamily
MMRAPSHPTQTLDRGWGSCRDFAVLFVEAARSLGFGVRKFQCLRTFVAELMSSRIVYSWTTAYYRSPKELSALNHLSLKPFSRTLLVEMLSAISISRFACVEPRKAFTAVGTSLFRFICINSRRLNSKVRHHSLLNANLKGNANIEAKIVLSATSKQMYRATPNVLSRECAQGL